MIGEEQCNYNFYILFKSDVCFLVLSSPVAVDMDLYGFLMRLAIKINICVIKVKRYKHFFFSRMGATNVGTDSLHVHVQCIFK